MIKRFFLALSLLAGLLSPAFAAGTITMSLTQRFDNSTHLPLSGGLMDFYQAGTTSTRQNAFQDSALTIPYANPLTLDSGGNIPQLFFADGVIKVRISNRLGVQQLVQDNIQVTGASSGGGGGGTVDPTTIIATGDLKARYGTGVLSGFVRANGRTIGSASSGATERANADAQTLFEYLWGADANLVVSTGRGASANADWVANKTLALPDWRGRALAGLDDMGNSAATRLTTASMSPNGITLGAVSPNNQTLTLAGGNIPTLTSTGLNTIIVNPIERTYAAVTDGVITNVAVGGGGGAAPVSSIPNWLSSILFRGDNNISVNYTNGSPTPLINVQPTMLATFYIKL